MLLNLPQSVQKCLINYSTLAKRTSLSGQLNRPRRPIHLSCTHEFNFAQVLLLFVTAFVLCVLSRIVIVNFISQPKWAQNLCIEIAHVRNRFDWRMQKWSLQFKLLFNSRWKYSIKIGQGLDCFLQLEISLAKYFYRF